MVSTARDAAQGRAREETSLPHVGTYRRELPVGLERLYENALDWEHLPWLHKSSFSKIECVEAGPSGFRARVWRADGERAPILIELRLNRECRRWITRTLEGPGQGTEIWTHAFPIAERQTDVVVDFFVPGITKERAEAIGELYCGLYARLYDEDVWMMSERQCQLDIVKSAARAQPGQRQVLGRLDELRTRLPLMVDAGGIRFKLVEDRNELVAYSSVCPHMLGPLGESEPKGGVVECPWHGYRFDIRTRQCLRGQRCSLPPPPRILVDRQSSEVTLEWRPPVP